LCTSFWSSLSEILKSLVQLCLNPLRRLTRLVLLYLWTRTICMATQHQKRGAVSVHTQSHTNGLVLIPDECLLKILHSKHQGGNQLQFLLLRGRNEPGVKFSNRAYGRSWKCSELTALFALSFIRVNVKLTLSVSSRFTNRTNL
jgi:hypothetical protein